MKITQTTYKNKKTIETVDRTVTTANGTSMDHYQFILERTHDHKYLFNIMYNDGESEYSMLVIQPLVLTESEATLFRSLFDILYYTE